MPLAKTASRPRINPTGSRQGRPPKDRTEIKQLRSQLAGTRDTTVFETP